ncbi:hypothetical protein [Paenibacillus agaridevorans]|uniref:hypothetical protein n=1 Tax=Paenibacillus agaridevorans TaxID=171404 RepID=UPI001BE4A2B5|nr:hypothetical protein [Paenibacillus agaridevorans]
MLAFIGLLSLLACFIFLIIAIVSVFRKNGKAKIQFLVTGVLFIVFIVALSLTPDAEDSNNSIADKSASSGEVTAQEVSTESEKEADKAAKEQAKKEAEDKKNAEAAAKKEAEEKKKAEKEAKKKAEEEAKLKAQEEKLKNPEWNVSEVDAVENGNIFLAVEMLRVLKDMPQGEYVDTEAVIKTPWNYYGTPITFTGVVAVVEDFPPGSDTYKAGLASDIVIETYEGTIVEFFSMVPSGSIKVGDEVTITSYPVGRTEVDNTMGGSFTHLITVTNNVSQ